MINCGFTDLSSDDIKALIEAEVSKGGEKADTDYIDLCFELLEIKNKNIVPLSGKTKSPKALLIAAVVAVLTVSLLTASAYYFNIPENIAKLVNGDAEVDINLDNADTTADGYALLESEFAKQLAENGISPVTVPEKMLDDDCVLYNIEYPETDKSFSRVFLADMKYKGFYGNVRITQSAEDFEKAGYNIKRNVISGQMINVNGMDILIFERKDSVSVEYKDNLTEYHIYLECDLETALEFADSIK